MTALRETPERNIKAVANCASPLCLPTLPNRSGGAYGETGRIRNTSPGDSSVSI